MVIAITIASILVITVVVWLTNRVLPVKVCPICTGVSLTWIWLMIAHGVGYPIALEIPALLMGGSVVGLAYQLEKKLPMRSGGLRKPLLWKTIFISTGFIVAYSLMAREWVTLIVSFVLLLLISLVFFLKPKEQSTKSEIAEDLKNKMKNCC